MLLPDDLTRRGFSLQKVSPLDFSSFFEVVKTCYTSYVNEFYGGWTEETQLRLNAKRFSELLQNSCFQKILLHGQIVGFFAFNEDENCICDLSVQILPAAQNQGMGSFLLGTVTALADRTGKPARLKVFKTNPAQNLCKRLGFTVTGETPSHFWMEYQPKQARP